MTALILAIFKGHVNIVELLLAREEIEINKQDEVIILLIREHTFSFAGFLNPVIFKYRMLMYLSLFYIGWYDCFDICCYERSC
jgi:hypothetical protein